MSTVLTGHLADYLRLRRALGFTLATPSRYLAQFIAYLDASDTATITVEAAMAWTRSSTGASQITLSHRLGAVRGFARYLATIDPATEVPPSGLFGKQQRHAPYVYSPEQITRLLAAAGQLHPRLRAMTYQTLFGLLAATGLRIGEAVALTNTDVDLREGVLRVRHAKFDRERLVPLHPSVTRELSAYAAHRDDLARRDRTDTFFVSGRGTPLRPTRVNDTFHALLAPAGLPTEPEQRPRVHDLRHAFVVHTLIDWQRDGTDIAARLPALSAYLGHVNPASTYWYFTAVPELMHLVATSLEPRADTVPAGGRQ